MELPVNFHWIPGYEQRYAMCVVPDSGNVIDRVYSANYPGALKGSMIPIHPKSYSPQTFVLSKDGVKETFRLSHLQDLVCANIAHHRRFRGTTTAEAASDVGRDEPEGVTRALNQAKMADEMGLAEVPEDRFWILLWKTPDGKVNAHSYPTEFHNLKDAEDDATTQASSHPGVEYFVVETVSKTVNAGVVTTKI